MKKIRQFSRFIVSVFLFASIAQFSAVAMARNTVQEHSIANAMATSTAKPFADVSFYFGEQKFPEIERFIASYTTRRTTNAFGKSDATSCQWAFLSGIKTLYERTIREGGNAVINIKSITTGRESNSSEKFVCRAGNVISKVYLSGEVVVLK